MTGWLTRSGGKVNFTRSVAMPLVLRVVAAVVRRLKGSRARRHAQHGRDVFGARLDGLEAVAGHQRHDLLVRVDLARLGQLLQHTDGYAARRLGEDALGARQQANAFDDLRVRGGLQRATRLVDDLQCVVPIRRIANRQTLGNRVRSHWADGQAALTRGLNHGRAALRLGADHLDGARLDQTNGLELAEALMHLGEQRTAGDRHDDTVGQAPAELLGNFEGQRLRAFRVVRAQVDIDEGPAVQVADLAAETVGVVVIAVDSDDQRLVDRRAN